MTTTTYDQEKIAKIAHAGADLHLHSYFQFWLILLVLHFIPEEAQRAKHILLPLN